MRRFSPFRFTAFVLLSGMICLFTVFCILLFAMSGETSRPEPAGRTYNPDLTVQAGKLAQQLETAYRSESRIGIEHFFDKWEKNYRSNSIDACRQNDTLAAVYTLFETFFRPIFKYHHPSQRQRGSIYRYAVIQSDIRFHVIGDREFKEYFESNDENYSYLLNVCGFDTYSVIRNFRPRIEIPDVKCLSLTPEYHAALNIFLGNAHSETGAGNIMSPARAQGESQRRADFLSDYFFLIYGHWGGYWQYETPPSVRYIILNNTLNKAAVETRTIYSGTGFLLYKGDSGWQKQRELYNWIE